MLKIPDKLVSIELGTWVVNETISSVSRVENKKQRKPLGWNAQQYEQYLRYQLTRYD